MGKLAKLYEAMRGAGYTRGRASDCIDALTIHACMCRARADSSDRPGFRGFVAAACDRTRDAVEMRNFRARHHREDHRVSVAACEALFDLIMEGVS